MLTINSMRPLIVSYTDFYGGAARAAYRLNSALRHNMINSSMLVIKKLSDEPFVITCETKLRRYCYPIFNRFINKIINLQKDANPILHSLNILPSRLYNHINDSRADVINLHWINYDALSIDQIGRIRKPVVFTLHDMWAFCGAEHLDSDFENPRYEQGYSKHTRNPGHKGLDLNRWTWQRKLISWQEPRNVICPSNWLANCVRSSALMGSWPVHVIPNVLDTEHFKPIDKKFSRQILGLPSDIPLIAFSNFSTGYYKGFDLLNQALLSLSRDVHIKGVECVAFGQNDYPNRFSFGFPVHVIGRIYDDWSLVLLYNAVDVVLVPSRIENLPQVATEANACGTPVVAFDIAGIPDSVAHKKTGYLAKPYSTDDFAYGIQWVLENNSCDKSLSLAARERAVSLWSPEIIVQKYIDIYKKATNEY